MPSNIFLKCLLSQVYQLCFDINHTIAQYLKIL